MLKNKIYIFNLEKVEENKFKFEFLLRNGIRIPIVMYIDKQRFPFELPDIYLDKEKQKFIPSIPHITSNGYVCYLDKEGVVWSDNPSKAFDFVFERVESILLQNESVEGIHREFLYYFVQVEGLEYMYSFISQGMETRKIKLFSSNKKKIKFVCDRVTLNEENQKQLENTQIINAIYVPFDKPLDIYVPNKMKFWTGKEIKELVNRCVSKENIDKMRDLTKNNIQNYYILDLLLADNQRVLIGLKYDNKKVQCELNNKNTPVLELYDEMDITPIYIERVDDKKTLTRGGAILNGKDFNLLIIGCGSVGSDIIFQFGRSGFKNLTLVDHDVYSEDNIYRHFLGKSRNKKEKYKVNLIKEELDNRYDELNISTYTENIFDLLEKGTIDLSKYSLIISAIGDINQERLLNKYIVKEKVPVIYSWVEAYGLGGHTVLINNDGCFNCLITDELRCKVNFAGKSSKPFVKNHGGCLGTFTPYGGVDSMQTAILTLRMAQEFLVNKVEENKVLSWKGNDEIFKANGYEVDKSYDLFTKEIGERDDIVFKGCIYCND